MVTDQPTKTLSMKCESRSQKIRCITPIISKDEVSPIYSIVYISLMLSQTVYCSPKIYYQ